MKQTVMIRWVMLEEETWNTKLIATLSLRL